MSEWTELTPIMNADVEAVFADWVLYFPVAGQPRMVKAHFDEAFEAIDMEGEVPVSTTLPVLHVILSSLPFEPKQDDEVQIGVGVTVQQYKVTDVQVDGNGGAKLMLVKKAE